MPHTPWSEEEDAALLSVVCRETSMSWSRVADLLPGRSQSSARNRYVRLTCREGEGWAVGDDFHLALLVFDDGRSLAEVCQERFNSLDNLSQIEKMARGEGATAR